MCRQPRSHRVVGTAGLELNRLTSIRRSSHFKCPVLMDRDATTPEYEEKGNDYPPGFVRWTNKGTSRPRSI